MSPALHRVSLLIQPRLLHLIVHTAEAIVHTAVIDCSLCILPRSRVMPCHPSPTRSIQLQHHDTNEHSYSASYPNISIIQLDQYMQVLVVSLHARRHRS
ncbi:hypothetical protein B0T12DRAFT_62082 [Alternaria alternata]|nr:hypothetical protein B0T12DRAFT_62082 [Alternaria alternata]